MADCGFNTAEFPLDEGKEKLQRFRAAVLALVAEMELHQLVYSVSVGVDDGLGGTVSIGDHVGCVTHSLIYTARFLSNALDHNGIQYFLALMQAEIGKRTEREAAELQRSTAQAPPPTVAAPVPVQTAPTEEDLLKMKLPEGAQKWKA